MLSHALRRALAACASLLLVVGFIGLTSSVSQAADGDGTISGFVFGPDGKGVKGVDVVVFKATSDPDHPWQRLQREDETFDDPSGTHPELVGKYDITLPPGTYRLGFLVGSEGEILEGLLKGQFYGDAQTVETGQSLEVTADASTAADDVHLRYTGGTISGTVTGVDGKPVDFAEVYGYSTSRTYGDEEPKNYDPDVQTYTNEQGQYTLRTRGKPLWLHFSQDSGGYVDQYFDHTTSWAEATALDATSGVALTGKDAVLAPLPLSNTDAPQLSWDLSAGGTARVWEGDWSSNSATYTYQWMRVSNGVSTPLGKPTTSNTRRVSSTDIGKKLQVVVTASQAGTPSVEATSNLSRSVKRGSSVYLSGTSPSKGKVTLKLTVKVTGITSPAGKVKLRYGLSSRYPNASRTVTFRKGKATITVKNLPRHKYFYFRATLSSTSTIAGSTYLRRVKVD
ncbi:hypothetical protein [Aeromicrobium sp. 9AM]|uniref:hypothetical protein n=1 Tax=Aeromicrobium sp. 9AM TaxID=2653126 RepID=UPI0012F04010|nr:hypothetical protein [Aeromicrobium sp. 9AM]VXC54559.1 exported hypothetical protein [Aeromicrobium sp. 9AM]